MALGAPPLAWFCAAAWPVFTPPLTLWNGSLLSAIGIGHEPCVLIFKGFYCPSKRLLIA